MDTVQGYSIINNPHSSKSIDNPKIVSDVKENDKYETKSTPTPVKKFILNDKELKEKIGKLADLDFLGKETELKKLDLVNKFGLNFDLLFLTFIMTETNQNDNFNEVLLNNYFSIIESRIDDFDKIEQYKELVNNRYREAKSRLKLLKQTAMKCMVCRKNEVSVLYLPCGHLVTCNECVSKDICQSCGVRIFEQHITYV